MRLRRWLLGTAVAAMVLLAGLIGYARHRARKALLDLPHMLGADIRSETNGFTYSQSVKGRTLFTIHAAKAIQRQNGKITLHDVQVTVYGEPGSNRTDSIRGAEFEYDQPNGVVRAVGETQIDLASPVAGETKESNGHSKRVSVQATGLVFLEKLGVAATEGPVHFDYGTMAGNARGADYDADTGMLQLRHDVHVLSRENGHIEQVDADSAEIDRHARTVLLQQATLRDANDVLRARTLHVQLRPEGSKGESQIEQARADGAVELETSEGMRITAPGMVADWAEGSHPRTVRMSGGVQMHSKAQGDGTAGSAVLSLNAAGQPARVVLQHEVRLATTTASSRESRVLTAEQVVGNFITTGRKAVLREAVATGTARVVMAGPGIAGGNAPATNTLTANTLHAFGAPAGSGWLLQRVEGDGSTEIIEASGKGPVRTSSGDHTVAVFENATAASSQIQTATASRDGLSSLVQQGHVVIVEHRPATIATGTRPARNTGESKATADRAEYSAKTDKVVLTGSPEITETGIQVAADRIEMDRTTGDAEVQGSVRGSYATAKSPVQTLGNAGPDMLHFFAARARIVRKQDRATLYAGDGGSARLWSGAGQVEAPVIEMDRNTGKLLAHGVTGAEAAYSVRTVLPSSQKLGASDGRSSKGPRRTGAMRVASRSLMYRQGNASQPGSAEFGGGIRIDEEGGQITADSAIAEVRRPSAGASGFMNEAVQKIVALGHVRVLQPGRAATGDRLEYTTADQQFVLTGTPGHEPTVRDNTRGTVSGKQLIFQAGDNSVEVAGAAGQPVHTDVLAPPRKPVAHTLDHGQAAEGKVAGPTQ